MRLADRRTVPMPTCPKLSRPQHHRVPSAFTAQVVLPLVLMLAQPVPSTLVGTVAAEEGAVADLAVVVASPAPRRAVGARQAGVLAAGGQ